MPAAAAIIVGQRLLDVTAPRGRVALSDPVTLAGRRSDAVGTADEFAAHLGAINHEIVTGIQGRVPRIAVEGP